MICVKDAEGGVVHLSPEWERFTGMPVAAAMGRGWLAAVSEADRAVVEGTLAEAVGAGSGYTLTYRLSTRAGGVAWVSDGAVASFGPEDRRFIGLLGSITEIPAPMGGARRALGRFDPPPPASSTLTRVVRDLAVDYVLIARSLAARDGDPALVEALDIALYLGRRRLVRSVH